MKYDIEQEAKKALFKLNKTPTKFCPLTKQTCRYDCICYVRPRIKEVYSFKKSKYTWEVIKGFCNNQMFTYGG